MLVLEMLMQILGVGVDACLEEHGKGGKIV